MRRVLLALLCVSCLDKAKPDWDRCVERDKAYDTAGAASACAAAVAADPKSTSGQLAQKRLVELQLMLDKMKAEHDDKTARDEAIKRASDVASAPTATAAPTVVATVGASAIVVQGNPLDQAQALFNAGDAAGARAILEPYLKQKPSREGALLLADICTAQHDNACLAKLKKIATRLTR